MVTKDAVFIHSTSAFAVGIPILLTIAAFGLVQSQLSGSTASCKKEGDVVHVKAVSENPCFTCICKNRTVVCSQMTCLSTTGCYVILFDNSREDRKCCDVCKGCEFEGKMHSSSSSWSDPQDPCITYTCKASVITKAVSKCYVPCSNPVDTPGQCCPSCKGCSFRGQVFKDGDLINTTDSCLHCSCQAGGISCIKKACPILNCPKDAVYNEPGKCCAKCKGERKIFNLPRGRCFFSQKIYNNGKRFKPENCTECECKNGTSICDSEVCPYLTCAEEHRIPADNSCCLKCPEKRRCTYDSSVYTHGQRWQPDACTACDCDNGVTHCQTQQCNNALWCPQGSTLQFDNSECCPRCVESRAVCTVFGDPHYKSFDGRMFNFQGPCKYILSEDCFEKSFSVRVRNDAKTSSSFTWTKMVAIYLNKMRINLHQRLRVKVNRKSVNLPYTHNDVPNFTIVNTGHMIVLKWSTDLTISWDGDSYVELSVSSKYKRKLCGLCGNFNGLGMDDLTGRDGRQYLDGEEFGETWRYGSRSACVIKHEVPVESQCLNNTVANLRARKECSFILGSVYHTCRREVDVRPYYSSCVTDTCECPENKRCECESFRAYARACAQHGIHISWETVAPCIAEGKCPVGSKLKRCASPCPRTCENYNKVEPCLKPCIQACQCHSGLVLHENTCISPRQCPGIY